MSDDGNQGLLGRLAVHKKLITMEQLVQATQEQGRFGNGHMKLGEILVAKAFLTKAQLEQLLVMQRAFLSELNAHAGGAAKTGATPATAPTSRPAPVSPPASRAAPSHAPAPAPPPRQPAGPLSSSSAAAPPFGLHPSSGHSPFAAGAGSLPPPAPTPAPAAAPLSFPSAGSDSLELDLDRTGSGPLPLAPGPAAPAAASPGSPPHHTPSFAGGDEELELDIDRAGASSWSRDENMPPPVAPAAASPATAPAPAAAPAIAAPALVTPPAASSAPAQAPSPSFELAFDPKTLPSSGTAPSSSPAPASEPEELLLEEEDAAELSFGPEPAGAVTSTGPSLTALSEPPGHAARLDAFLAAAARRGASDVHLHPGAPPKLRLVGALVDAAAERLEARFVEEVLHEALNPAQRALLDERGQIDLAYSVDGIGRFRANLYRGLTGLNGVFRFVPGFVPSLTQLGLPQELSKLTTFHQGLVLVTGPAGCGKSTTLASLVNIINEERHDHILTIEDPVEYLHPSKRCLVNQRQVSRHTGSFARALRAALREDPDVIVIGELRDLETISLALTAAETGHLVLGTLHTSSAIRTVNRLIGAFPPNEQPQIRSMISESLRAIISQRLMPRQDGQGRVSALEVLHVNKAVANTIRENKAFQLRSMMQTGRAQGMLLLDQSLQDLVRAGVVSKEEASRHVEDPRFLQ